MLLTIGFVFAIASIQLVGQEPAATSAIQISAIERQASVLYNQKRYVEAFALYQQDANLGGAAGQYWLGEMYLFGMGTTRDLHLSFSWLQKAAANGSSTAPAVIGQFFLNGWGVPNGWGVQKDNAQAASWFRMGALMGDADAQYSMAFMYLNGFGVSKDPGQARAWYQKAADQGLQAAKDRLNQMDALARQNAPEAKPAQVVEQAAPVAQQTNSKQGTCAVVYGAGVYFDAGNNQAYGAAWSRTTIEEAQSAARDELMKIPGGSTINSGEIYTIASGCAFAHGAVAGKLKTQWQTGEQLGSGIYDVIAANLATTTNDAINTAMAGCSNTKGLGGDNEVCAVLEQW